jgi:hypothetical protein
MRVRPLVLVAVLLAPALAGAQYDSRRPPPPRYAGPRDQGLTLSARVGFGLPGGDISDDRDATGARIDPGLDQLLERKIPILLELGYRFGPTVWGGLFLELGPASVDDDFCPPGPDCEANDIRFGVDVQFHLQPRAAVDPWIGIGLAAEFLEVEAYDPSVDRVSDFSWGGLELPLLEAGLDVALSDRGSIGPYVSWSIAHFTRWDVATPGFADESGRIDERAIHTWIEIGLKGTLKL